MSALLIATIVTSGQGGITLQYQPKVGSTYKYTMTQGSKSQMGNSGFSCTMAQKVLSGTGGVYKIQSTTSNVKSDAAAGGDGMKKLMEGKSTLMTIDKYGTVTFDPKGAGGAASQMMGGFNGQSIGMAFPKKPVKVGDTWTSSLDMGKMMNSMMKGQTGKAKVSTTGMMNMKFKLVKVDGSSASISCTVSGNMNMDMTGPGQGGAPQAMKMSTTISGTANYSVDRATGMPINSTTNMTMNMSFGGQKMPMTQSISLKKI